MPPPMRCQNFPTMADRDGDAADAALIDADTQGRLAHQQRFKIIPYFFTGTRLFASQHLGARPAAAC
jgi:hypothetical protein